MKYKIGLISILLGVQFGCADCLDCDVLNSEPAITFTFINQSKIVEQIQFINTLEETTDVLDSILSIYQEQEQTILDSIAVLQDSVNSGNTSYDSLIQQLEEESLTIQQLIEPINLELNEVNVLLDEERMLLDNLENGNTRIDSLIDLMGGKAIAFTDSAEQFGIPLNIKQPATKLRVVLPEEAFQVMMEYNLEPYEDDKSRIGFIATEISVVNHSFDSLQLDCGNNCTSDESNVVAYY